MNYELAKKLKDAGFPQNKEALKYPPYKAGDDTSQMEAVYSPTLEELIEECENWWWEQDSNEFIEKYGNMPTIHFSLTHSQVEKSSYWVACLGMETYERIENPENVHDLGGGGYSPQEAVANLWLKLNQ